MHVQKYAPEKIWKHAHCEKKEVYLAENMEDFELHEDYFYINMSSYNDENGNRHWLASFWPSKTYESFSAKTKSNWKIENRILSKLLFPWVKGVDFDGKLSYR